MIPHTIHQIVLGNVRPPLVEICMNSWRALSSGAYRLWDDAAVSAILQQFFPEFIDLYTQSRNPAEASDIARLAILYQHGGYYIDWDIELLAPAVMASFMESHCGEDCWAILDPRNGCIANELLAFGPKSELLRDFLRHLSGVPVGQRPFTPQFSGPWGFTEWYRRSGYPLRLFPTCQLFRCQYKHIPCPPANQPLMHHWMHSWMPKPGPPGPVLGEK